MNNTPIAVAAPSHPAKGLPHASKRSDTASIPAVVAAYLVRWESDLGALGAKAGEAFATGALSRLTLG